MTKQSAKDSYERIREYVDQYARAHYDGAQEQGFRHWAFAELFLEHNLSDTDVIDKTEIDGPDDFGIDGYYIEDAEDERVIHLFQSKYRTPGTSMGDKELLELLDAPAKLLNKEMVAACHNEETQYLHDELAKLIPQDFALSLIWVTTGTLSRRARHYAEARANQTVSAEINGNIFNVKVSFEAYDLRDLISLFQSHLEGDDISPCDVQVTVNPDRCHEVRGDYNTLELTIPAKQIIDIFRQHRYKIFRLNPRGPLGNKTNVQIKNTLQDETLRHMFHILNNGISAICDSYSWKGSSISIRDFLVVNGCQTTVTLDSVRAIIGNDTRVLVNLKLIEAPQHLHRLIARTTNTQASLRAEDFISTHPIQIELQRQFASLTPPWFYQIKRSEWSRMTIAQQKERYREESGTYRWLKSKDVAQAAVALLGFPGEAKDKIRFFFEAALSSEFGELSYKDVYAEGLSAIQLLLPALMYKKITTEVDRDKTGIASAPGMDWLDYARFHLLWLSGELLRSKYRLPRALSPKDLSKALIDSIEEWVVPLYKTARASIMSAVRDLQERERYRGHREFFRSAENYRLILEKLPLAIDFARSSGLDPLAKLPIG